MNDDTFPTPPQGEHSLDDVNPLEHAPWLRGILCEVLRQHLGDSVVVDLTQAAEAAARGAEDGDLGEIRFEYGTLGDRPMVRVWRVAATPGEEGQATLTTRPV